MSYKVTQITTGNKGPGLAKQTVLASSGSINSRNITFSGRLLGRGGFGEIRHAYDRSGVPLAVKVQSENFMAGERIAAEIQLGHGWHENVVGCYGTTEENGYYYNFMEYISGKTLTEALREGKTFTLVDALKLLKQAASGVNYFHNLSLGHNDIKLDNLMITEDGQLKLVDFGLVAPLNLVSNHWTNGYGSPERVLGEKIDQRSDIWALAVVFCTIVTARHPFDTTENGNFSNFNYHDNVKLNMFKEDLSPETKKLLADKETPRPIRKLLGRMLDVEASRRPRSCAEIIKTIDQSLEKLEGKRPSFWQRFSGLFGKVFNLASLIKSEILRFWRR